MNSSKKYLSISPRKSINRKPSQEQTFADNSKTIISKYITDELSSSQIYSKNKNYHSKNYMSISVQSLQVLKMSDDHKIDKIDNFEPDEDIVKTGTPSKVNTRSNQLCSRKPKMQTRTQLDHYLSVFK